MREIKFRGFDGKKWRYGSLYINHNAQYASVQANRWDMREVLYSTVGQFTGLLDSNGKEIYEGDIVRVVHYGEESIHTVKYCDDEDYPAFDLDPHFDCESNGLSFCKCERETTITVIGNVHDNPNLLEADNARD